MRRRSLLGLATAALLGGALLVPATGQAKTTIVTGKKAFTVDVPRDYVESDGFYSLTRSSPVTVYCPRRGDQPLTIGWSGAGAFLDVTGSPGLAEFNRYQNRWDFGYIGGDLRYGGFGGKRNTALVVCARVSGKAGVKMRVKTTKKQGVTISCGRDVAIGQPLRAGGGSFYAKPSGAYPLAANRWISNLDREYFDPDTLCAPRRLFGSVRVVKQAGVIRANQIHGRVTITCPPRHRPIAWGWQAGVVPGFAAPSGDPRTVPFVSLSYPQGARKWVMQFTTPLQQPATGPTAVTAYATCAVPA